MPHMPAFCDSCGTIFKSGFSGENSQGNSFIGNISGPCPKCGGMGHVPDGVFDFIDDTIIVLSAPERTYSELARLNGILQEARAKSETKEEISSHIEKEFPDSPLRAKLLEKIQSIKPWELIQYLTITLYIVSKLLTAQPHTQITVNVDQIIQNILLIPPTQLESYSPFPFHKPGRNDPCYCGSDLKYKKCHGALI